MATLKQAELIGAKLYTQDKNQKHCAEWAMTLTHANASRIIGQVIKLKYDLAMGNDANKAEYNRIQQWGRNEIQALGYVEITNNRAN